MTKLEMKEIRKALTTPGTKFTISGNCMVEYKVFTVHEGCISNSLLNQMNVEYIGSTHIDLYTFDMLGKKSKGTIYFKDVTIVNQ